MNKSSKIMGTTVIVAGVAAASYLLLLKPQPTPPDVKAPVNEQYKQLVIQLNDLEAQVQQPEANVDSLLSVLETVKWTPVKDGGDYELEKRALFLDAKKNVAMAFYGVVQQLGLDTQSPLLSDIEGISE